MQAVPAAALMFDKSRGTKMSTFIYSQVRFGMWKALQEETHTVLLSPYYLSIMKKIEDAAKKCGRFFTRPLAFLPSMKSLLLMHDSSMCPLSICESSSLDWGFQQL